jgi:hypothetical protein
MRHDDRLEKILSAWSDALGTLPRLRAQRAVAMQGVIHIFSSGELGFCGTLEAWYTAGGDLRLEMVLASVSRVAIVFNARKNKGWLLSGGEVSELPPDGLANLTGYLYLLTYSWRLPDRIPGTVRYLREDIPARQYVLETEPKEGTPFTVCLGVESALPEQLRYHLAPPLDHLVPAFPVLPHLVHLAGFGLASAGPALLDSAPKRLEPAQDMSVAVQGWREAGGIRFPVRFTLTRAGGPGRTAIEIDGVTLDPELPPGFFDKPVPPKDSVHFIGGGSRVRVPFELVTNNIFVATSVDGSAPLSFALDTGTSIVALDKAEAKKLEIPCVCRSRSLLGGGSVTSEFCVTPKMELRIRTLEADRRGLAIDLRGLSHDKVGQPVNGILGGTLLSSLIVEVDYAARWVELASPRSRNDPGGVKVPLLVSGGVPFVRMRLTLPDQEVEALLMVDTGTQSAIILNKPFVDKYNLLTAVSPTISTIDFGLGGEVPYAIGRLASARLGTLEIARPVVNLAKAAVGSLGSSEFAGFLGAQVLQRTRVTFDYSRRQMHLTPGKAFHAPYEYGMSGMVLVAKGPRFDRFVVAYVIADSPASEAGIQVQDRITSIDGRPAAGFTLSRLKDMFLEAGRRYLLGVARGTSERPVEIRLRPLI